MTFAAVAGLCMIVVNMTSVPVQLVGCIPAPDWVTDGCKVFGDYETKVDNLVFTVAPGWPPTVLYDVMTYDSDDIIPAYRLWIEPKGVDVHWRNPCPTTLAEFRTGYERKHR